MSVFLQDTRLFSTFYDVIDISNIKGGDAAYNAKRFIKMLDGLDLKYQYIVELNAGAALYLAKKTKNLKEGFQLARYVIENRIAKKFLEKIVKKNA